jgi:hypothetical protein
MEMGFWDLVLPGQGPAKPSASTALVPVRKAEPSVARATFQGGSHRQPEPAAAEPVFASAGSDRKKRHEGGGVGDCFQQGYCGTCDQFPRSCPIAKTHLPKVDDIPCGGIYA